jgi:hypothetical protein
MCRDFWPGGGGWLVRADAFPVAVAVGSAHQPQVGALEPHAIDHQFAAQQRKQFRAELRALPATMGRREPGAVAEAARPVRSASQGKKPSSMSPTSAKSRPVAFFTSASMRGLKVFGSTTHTTTATPARGAARVPPGPGKSI